ncbi:GNAT family N-acetyltransferase [Nocardiopsis mangrovi]|uniref:GNAT family N-acetyltransferase n=1 Tax=Nocardiopsis mangrovi TaxID=1179818 RepID=A0ABV9DSS8_9ACTN
MHIRAGGPEDTGTLLAMFDGAVEWLVANGRRDQWGPEPWSVVPARVERVRSIAAGGGLWIAEDGGEPAGAMSLIDGGIHYVPPADGPGLYVDLLITARGHTGGGVGARLLNFAREQTRARGIGLLRVDCWAGGDGALIRYYTRQGFTPVELVPVGDTAVQLFEQRL